MIRTLGALGKPSASSLPNGASLGHNHQKRPDMRFPCQLSKWLRAWLRVSHAFVRDCSEEGSPVVLLEGLLVSQRNAPSTGSSSAPRTPHFTFCQRAFLAWDSNPLRRHSAVFSSLRQEVHPQSHRFTDPSFPTDVQIRYLFLPGSASPNRGRGSKSSSQSPLTMLTPRW